MTGWPTDSASLPPTTRATMSACVPAANGTTRWIGRLGYASMSAASAECAQPIAQAVSQAITAKARRDVPNGARACISVGAGSPPPVRAWCIGGRTLSELFLRDVRDRRGELGRRLRAEKLRQKRWQASLPELCREYAMSFAVPYFDQARRHARVERDGGPGIDFVTAAIHEQQLGKWNGSRGQQFGIGLRAYAPAVELAREVRKIHSPDRDAAFQPKQNRGQHCGQPAGAASERDGASIRSGVDVPAQSGDRREEIVSQPENPFRKERT